MEIPNNITDEKEFVLTSEEASSRFDPSSLLYQEEGLENPTIDAPQSIENLSQISANGDSFICLHIGDNCEILGSLDEISFCSKKKKDKLSLSSKVSIQTMVFLPNIKNLPLTKFSVFVGGNEQAFTFDNFLLKKIKYYQLGQSTALCRMVFEHYL